MTLPDEVRSLLERSSEILESDGWTQTESELRTFLAAQPEPQGVDDEARLKAWADDKFTATGAYKPRVLGQVYGNTDWAMARAIYSDLLSTERAEAERKMVEKDAEIAELDALRNRLSDLLSQSVIAIRGPEPELTRYGWADLPTRVKTVVDDNAKLRARVAELEAGLAETIAADDAAIGEIHLLGLPLPTDAQELTQRLRSLLNQPQANSQEGAKP